MRRIDQQILDEDEKDETQSNRELEELQKEIHRRKSQPVAITVDHDKELDKITKQTRQQKVLKLINDYEATFGKKPKYHRSNVELEQLQSDLEGDKKNKLKIMEILSSFEGFSNTYRVKTDSEPLERLIKSAI
ncbi:hypothetical protein CHS0354_020079 [Potamilus streckersoni]|uniref:Uncharacterized protein n=1 Tax=Potamilus streckersoni TaxID=2493646 RepID=A0AAE0SCM4_9BIVA|nr:hypothetical protein CHS0354_020079 [Potamilus streckersoni]